MKTRHRLLFAVVVALFFRVHSAEAQCSVQGGVGSPDSNTSTQCFGNIAAPLCPACPGFNPQNLLKHVDPASGSRDPYFSRIGPGAVTDNMFAIVSGTDPGPDGILGTGDDIPTSRCGITEGSPTNGLPGLNCGDLRFNDVSQGMSVPALLGGMNNAAKPFTSSMPAEADFCNQNGDDCIVAGIQKTDAHMGLRLENLFQWANSPVGGLAPPPPSFSQQSELQVVSVTAGRADAAPLLSGTLDGPLNGDQVTLFTTYWSTTNTDAAFTAPKVSWTQAVTEPLSFDGAGGNFYQDTSGSFDYHAQARDVDPVTLHDRLIPVVSYPQGPIGSGTTIP